MQCLAVLLVYMIADGIPGTSVPQRSSNVVTTEPWGSIHHQSLDCNILSPNVLGEELHIAHSVVGLRDSTHNVCVV